MAELGKRLCRAKSKQSVALRREVCMIVGIYVADGGPAHAKMTEKTECTLAQIRGSDTYLLTVK